MLKCYELIVYLDKPISDLSDLRATVYTDRGLSGVIDLLLLCLRTTMRRYEIITTTNVPEAQVEMCIILDQHQRTMITYTNKLIPNTTMMELQ